MSNDNGRLSESTKNTLERLLVGNLEPMGPIQESIQGSIDARVNDTEIQMESPTISYVDTASGIAPGYFQNAFLRTGTSKGDKK